MPHSNGKSIELVGIQTAVKVTVEAKSTAHWEEAF